MNELDHMRAFWDQKAKDNPLWYVTTTLDYASPDEDELWQTGEAEAARVLSDAHMDGGSVAVDIGCGVGRLTRPLARRFRAVHAFDISPRMIGLARKNLAGFPGVQVQATSGDGTLPLPDSCADFVLSMQVFHHIPERRITLRYIREAGRVLAPGGALGFQLRTCRMQDPVFGRCERIVRGALEKVRRRRTPPPADLDAPAWHGSRVLLSEIRRAARTAGMHVESVHALARKGANVQVICRKETR